MRFAQEPGRALPFPILFDYLKLNGKPVLFFPYTP